MVGSEVGLNRHDRATAIPWVETYNDKPNGNKQPGDDNPFEKAGNGDGDKGEDTQGVSEEDALKLEAAKTKAKALSEKLRKGKVSQCCLKLDAFSKELPRDIPRDDRYRSRRGVFFSIVGYLMLAAAAAVFVEVTLKTGILFDEDD